MKHEWVRAVSISTMIAATAYLATALWAGRTDVLTAVDRVGAGTTAVLLGLSLANYGSRFIRWQLYLRRLGCRIPVLHSLRIYFGGFALTTTPGKAGELARTVWLRPYGIPASRSIAVFFAERMQDFIAILLFSCLGLSLYPGERWLLWVGAGGVSAALLVLFVPAIARVATRWSPTGNGRVTALIHQMAEVLTHMRGCLAPGPLVAGLALGVLAWSVESWGFDILLRALGYPLPLATAFSIYAFSMLTGGISFLPGGLGGSEAAMIILLRLVGVPLSVAVAGTLLIRLTTLWFAVLLGIIALSVRATVPAGHAMPSPVLPEVVK